MSTQHLEHAQHDLGCATSDSCSLRRCVYAGETRTSKPNITARIRFFNGFLLCNPPNRALSAAASSLGKASAGSYLALHQTM